MARSRIARLALVHARSFGPRVDGAPLGLRGALASGSLLLWAGLAFGGSPAQATVPGLNGRIVCEGVRPAGVVAATGTNRTEIFSVNPDGSDEKLLTNNLVRDSDPVYSPDGATIAFESLQILVGTSTAGVSEIFTMNALDGSDQRRLTTNGSPADGAPTWSPDGMKIAFHTNRDPLPAGAPQGSNTLELYSMNADGGDQVRLTRNLVSDSVPAWSPDGRRIAFLSLLENDSEVYTMDPDGTNTIRETYDTAVDGDPSYSPDGKQIVFRSSRTGVNDLYRQNTDGTGTPTRLTFTETASEAAPVWSPDGQRIAFNGAVTGATPANTDIFTIDAVDGSDLTRITTTPGTDQRCDWQPLPRPLPPPVLAPPVVQPPVVAPPPPPPPPVPRPVVPDVTAPIVSLSRVPAVMSRAAFLKGVQVKVRRNEASSIEATLEASARRATLAALFPVALASRTVASRSGTSTLTLKPNRFLVGRVKSLRARLRVVVTDAAGNRRIVTKHIKVKR